MASKGKIKSSKGFASTKTQSDPKNIRLKGDHYFKVSIESDIIDSWVKCWILNLATKESTILNFHLLQKNGRAYTEVAIPTENRSKYAWVENGIDLIAPMICRAVLSIE